MAIAYIYKIMKGLYFHYLAIQAKIHCYKSSRQLHFQS